MDRRDRRARAWTDAGVGGRLETLSLKNTQIQKRL